MTRSLYNCPCSENFSIAGGETTSTFLAATTYYLCKTLGAYQKLCNEIRGAFASYNSIDALKAQQLLYLQAVIAEGLRMYPLGSQGFPRISPGTPIDGHWVPRGVRLFVPFFCLSYGRELTLLKAEIYTSAWTVTHDEKNFHEPMEFKPERWIDPECTDDKEASQPFSLGPRGCLGRK